MAGAGARHPLVRDEGRGLRAGAGAAIVHGSLIAASLAVVVLALLSRFTIASVWDDAYIVLRYADQAIATGALSFNPGGAPTYGLTSPLYLAVVAPFRFILPSSPALAVLLSSLLCGLISVGLMARLATEGGALEARSLRVFVTLLLASLALSAGSLAVHLSSGMDTTFAMAWLGGYLLLAGRRGRAASTLAGVFGGLAFSARPDLLLFTFSIPTALALAGTAPEDRAAGWRMLRSTVVVLALQLAFTTWYFDSTLPLAFHAKASDLYGASMREIYAGVALAQFRAFVRSFWPLILVAVLGILTEPGRWGRRGEPLEKGVLVGALLFLGYHAFFVLPIMYYSQRFYYPALPALAYLASRGLARLLETGRSPSFPKPWTRAGLALAALLVSAGLAQEGLTHWRALDSARRAGTLGRFEVARHFTKGGMNRVWPGLDVIAALPDDLTVATTEVGFPAVMNPAKRIIDLAGLNETDIALGRKSPAEVLRAERPDVLYLPHPDYREMNGLIRDQPGLLDDYEVAPGRPAPPTLQIAILRTSRHFEVLRRVLPGP